MKNAEKKKILLKALKYENVIAKIDYKPPDKVEWLIKKFFFKKHVDGSYRFRDTTFLLYLPNTPPVFLEEQETMYNEFTKEELSIYFKVAEAIYPECQVKHLKSCLVHYVFNDNYVGFKLRDKFPELFNGYI